MSRPIEVPRWAIYSLLFGLYLTARGYESLDGDQAYRLPLLLHQNDPTLFADDPFVRAFDAFNPHRGYLALLDLATRPFGLSFGLFALFAATFALTCLGISRLARSAWPDGGPHLGLVAVGLVLMAKAGNIGTNHLFEPMLLDRLIGFALGWVALALAIEGEALQPSILIGLAAVIHPSVGLQLGGLIGASWVAWSIASRWTGHSWRSSAIGVLTLSLALIPGALPNLLQGRRLFEGLSPDEFRRIGVELQMAQHMVPSLWRRPQWLAWGGYVVLGWLALLRPVGGRGPREAGPVRFTLVLAVLLVGLGLAYVLVEVVGDLRATVFQPFRMATVARGLALVALAGRCDALWRRGDLAARARVLVLVAGLTGDWAFVVAVTLELASSLLERLAPLLRSGLSLGPLPPCGGGLGWGVIGRSGWIAFGLTAAYGLFFLIRHDTERGHRAIAMALVAAVVVRILGPRLRPGWTRRRLGFAVAGCWLLPASAMLAPTILGPDHPLTSALAARCRFAPIPTDDVERLAVWAKKNTPQDARFITPPGPKTFRLWSARSVAFNRAASPYHAGGLKDWSDRFRAHVGFEGTTTEFVRAYLADRHGLESRYNRLSPEGLAKLAIDQGADHILALSPGPSPTPMGPLRLLRSDGRYAIYRVEADASVARSRAGDRRR